MNQQEQQSLNLKDVLSKIDDTFQSDNENSEDIAKSLLKSGHEVAGMVDDSALDEDIGAVTGSDPNEYVIPDAPIINRKQLRKLSKQIGIPLYKKPREIPSESASDRRKRRKKMKLKIRS